MGSREQALIHGFPNGETPFNGRFSVIRSGATLVWSPATGHDEGFGAESIGSKGEPGELKHLSTPRKGHQRDSVSSGERTRTRPAAEGSRQRNRLESLARRVTAPYATSRLWPTSRAGHATSCLNMGGPSSKPKYSSATDSEPVP
jgi:hypothetical protein